MYSTEYICAFRTFPILTRLRGYMHEADSKSIQVKMSVPRGALTLKDAAEYLGGLNPETVRRLVKRGLLKPNRSLRWLLFPVVELDRFLAEGSK